MKLTDREFWTGLEKSNGIFAEAVKWYKANLDVEITRNAVLLRANKDRSRLESIRAARLDEAERVLDKLTSHSGDDRVKLQGATFILKTLGKSRGYSERHEITGEDGKELNVNITIKK